MAVNNKIANRALSRGGNQCIEERRTGRRTDRLGSFEFVGALRHAMRENIGASCKILVFQNTKFDQPIDRTLPLLSRGLGRIADPRSVCLLIGDQDVYRQRFLRRTCVGVAAQAHPGRDDGSNERTHAARALNIRRLGMIHRGGMFGRAPQHGKNDGLRNSGPRNAPSDMRVCYAASPIRSVKLK
jgi:hypothetical protein